MRVLLKQDYKAVASARRICEVEGGVVSERVAQRWFQRSNIPEENTKIYHVLKKPKLWEIGNTVTVLAEYSKKKVLVSCQKNLGHQKIP